MITGIYQIRNKVNSKVYVGQAKDILWRFTRHKSDLKRKDHSNEHLQSAFNQYGIINFEFEILEEVQDIKLLVVREQYWLDFKKAYDPNYGYNIAVCSASSNRGKSLSEETRKKISTALKGCIPWNKGLVLGPRPQAHIESTKEGRRLAMIGKTIKIIPEGQWSKKYKACIKCGTVERKYGGKGLCINCAMYLRTVKQRGYECAYDSNGQRIFTPEHCKKLSIAAKRREIRKKEV
jgi:group I intron endonuclease